MKAIGIILAGGNNSRMQELSNKRAIAAMPIGGSYRSIDFALSNMSNSHVQTVAVLTQYSARSLNEHLSSSKWWDFGRKQGGLFVFNPTVTVDNSWWYRGTADAMYQNINFLKKRHEPYVIITSGDCIYKLDYNKVLEYHIEKKADITVVCKDMEDGTDVTRFGCCIRRGGEYVIELSERLLEAEERACMQTLAHEVLHTCPGCRNHGALWKEYAARMNGAYGYAISRTGTCEALGVADVRPVRYRLVCERCGQEFCRSRRSPLVDHPERYRCRCGGVLRRSN